MRWVFCLHPIGVQSDGTGGRLGSLGQITPPGRPALSQLPMPLLASKDSSRNSICAGRVKSLGLQGQTLVKPILCNSQSRLTQMYYLGLHSEHRTERAPGAPSLLDAPSSYLPQQEECFRSPALEFLFFGEAWTPTRASLALQACCLSRLSGM